MKTLLPLVHSTLLDTNLDGKNLRLIHTRLRQNSIKLNRQLFQQLTSGQTLKLIFIRFTYIPVETPHCVCTPPFFTRTIPSQLPQKNNKYPNFSTIYWQNTSACLHTYTHCDIHAQNILTQISVTKVSQYCYFKIVVITNALIPSFLPV